jgi:inner membrane protein
MHKLWLGKAAVVALLLLVLKLVLMSIAGIVDERAGRQQEVVQQIAASNYGAQSFAGPILVLPYVEEYEVRRNDSVERHRYERALRVFPAAGDVAGDVGVTTKARGLFKARVFEWTGSAEGRFVLGEVAPQRTHPDSRVVWGQAFISLPVGDPRGLAKTPAMQWNGRPLAFDKGSGLAQGAGGVHAKLPEFEIGKPQQFKYKLDIVLRGTQSMAVFPLADDNRIVMDSKWPHPSFGGQFLPNSDSQQVSRSGFHAEWNISALASNAQKQFANAIGDVSNAERLEVRFIEPIDIYSLSDRALKYGFLFILLTFGCFLLFEVLKGLRIHPAQYLMVGLALATFFLLLTALSEHIEFWIAYAGASAACIALLAIYLSAVLAGVLRGLAFATLLTALYGALYGLLISEDNALLLGALLVFGMLAIAMLSTRNIDWYALTQRPGQDPLEQ